MLAMRRKIATAMKVTSVALLSALLGSCGYDESSSAGSTNGGAQASGPPANPDQVSYYDRWANKNATDAQIDSLLRDMPRPVDDWQATITNVYEQGDYTIIETAYGNQNYQLWIFEPDARERARQLYAQTEVVFSGEIVQELSLTTAGARDNPEFGVYASRVTGGGIEITQTPEGIAQQHELDRQAVEQARAEAGAESRDSRLELQSIELCQQMVAQRLKYPVSGEFSWFQGKTRKESDSQWVYTDVVTSITDSGKKQSTQFVCTVTVKNDELHGEVKFLN